MANNGDKRSKEQTALDRARIAEMYLTQWTQTEIAAELGISQPTVSRDLKAIRKAWVASAVSNFDELKQRELERIDRLEREYWKAWEASKEIHKAETRRASEGGQKTATVRTEDRTGDPRYLAGIQWCINQRCKILGIEAPVKNEGAIKVVVEYADYNPKTSETS